MIRSALLAALLVIAAPAYPDSEVDPKGASSVSKADPSCAGSTSGGRTRAAPKPAPAWGPCCPEPRPWPDVLIAVMFTATIFGVLWCIKALAGTKTVDADKLEALKKAVDELPTRAQEQAEAARAWGLQAFETVMRASRSMSNDEPAVYAVVPRSVPLTPTEPITIVGRGFTIDAKVFVNGIDVTSDAKVTSDREISVKAPTSPTKGFASVTIVLPSGRAAYLDHAFSYA